MAVRKTRPSDGMRRAYQHLVSTFSGAPLTLPQTAVLGSLLHHGPLNQTQLVAACGVDRSTLGEMLKRLATMGAVVALRTEADKRAILVSLTPKGRAMLLKAQSVLSLAEASLMQMVPAADRTAFMRALTAIAEAQ